MSFSQVLLLFAFLFPNVSALRLSVSSVGRLGARATTTSQPKQLPQIVKNLKLPVWPVWAGVVAQVFDWIGQPKISESIVSTIGGRVVPMTLNELDVSPFLLLAHHSHSFTPLDPFRTATKLFLPEGFPAHPHSGFDTVTFCLTGGLRHRDSESIQMKYGDGDVQWMRAGRGVIHEEMWDVDKEWEHKRIEIFQLWVNLPQSAKGNPPSVHRLLKKDIPVCTIGEGISIKLISGSLSNAEGMGDITSPGSDIAQSPVNIMHLSMSEGSSAVELQVGGVEECSMTVYVRRGSLLDGGEEVRSGDLVVYRLRPNESVPATVRLTAGTDGLDALILTGVPLKERVIWSGPLVQSNEASFQKSAQVFNTIGRGSYWDYTISDAEWKQHCQKLRLQEVISAVNDASYDPLDTIRS